MFLQKWILAAALGALAAVAPAADESSASLVNGWNNGDFEQPAAGTRVPGWYFGKYDGGTGEAAVVKSPVHGGSGAARLTQISPTGWVQLVQARELRAYPAGAKVKVGIWIYTENVKAGSVVFFGKTAAGVQRQWQTLLNFSGTAGWRHCEKTVELEAGLKEIYLAVRLNGPGMAWVDDATVTWPAQPAEPQVLNPRLTGKPDATGDLAPHWSRSMVKGGETVADFEIADGVLNLNWLSGGAEFGAVTEPSSLPEPGTVWEWRAELRTAKNARARLVVSALDKQGEVIDSIRSPEVAAPEFQAHNVVFRVPQGARRVLLEWVAVGDGTVQFRHPELARSQESPPEPFPIQALPLPVTGTETWNGGKAEFNTFSNAPVPLAFHFKGDAAGLKDPALVIEIPMELKLTEVLFPHSSFLTAENPVESTVTRQNRPYRRYSIVNPKVFSQLARADYAWERKLAMTLEPAQAGCENQSFELYWYLTADHGAKRSEVRHFPVNILPPLPRLANPKNFPFIGYTSEDLNFNSPERVAAIASNYEEANMHSRSRGHSEREIAVDQLLEKRGWRMCVTSPDYICENFVKGSQWPAVRDRVEFVQWDASVKNPGPRRKICPQYFTTDPEFKKYFHDFLVERMKQRGLKNGEWVVFDIEPWETMDWCFCDRCRNDFAAWAKLSGVPTAAQIRSDYRDGWRDFRCLGTARMSQMHAAAIRAAFPDSKIIDYDYVVHYNDPNFRNYYARVAKDPQLNERWFDAHFASFYHYVDKNAFDLIDLNIKHLKKDYWVIGAIDRKGYLRENEVVSPARFRMLMLATATAGGKGFGLWPGKHIDGRFFVAINQAMFEIARIEELIAGGVRADEQVTVAALPYAQEDIVVDGKTRRIVRPNWRDLFGYHAWALGGRTLTALFNYSADEPLFVRVGRPGVAEGRYTVFDPVANRRLRNARGAVWSAAELQQGVLIRVAPQDVVMLEIRPAAAGDETMTDWALESDWQKLYLERCAEAARRTRAFQPVEQEGMKISLHAGAGGTPAYRLETPVQQLLIAPEGGVLRSWRVFGRELCKGGTDGQAKNNALLYDFFWLPENLRDGVEAERPLELLEARIADGRLYLSLTGKRDRGALALTKTIVLNRTEPGFEVHYELRNLSSEARTVSFWAHHFPRLTAPGKLLTDMIYEIPTTAGRRTITGASAQYLFPVQAGEHPGFADSDVSGIFQAGPIRVGLRSGDYGFTVTPDPAQLMMVYIWFAGTPTLEWMYQPVRLRGEQTWRTRIGFLAWQK